MNTEEPFREDPSDELAQRIAYLINGYIRKKLTVSEHKELDEWVSASMKNQELFEELTDPVNIKRWIYRKEGIDSEAALERVKTKLGFKQEFQFYKQRRIWPYWVVAAAVLGVIFYSIHLYRKAAILRSPVVVIHQDLPPGGKHAILTLNNGRNILLDTVKSGEIAASQNIQITKDSAELNYVMGMKKNSNVAFDILNIPAGGEYQVRLSDGTEVWLNASSMI